MGRYKKSYVPVITEENKRLAEEYMSVISEYYEDYLKLFANMFGNGEDVVGDTLVKTYNTISHNGLPTVVGKEAAERRQIFKNYFFISCKLNSFTEAKNIERDNAFKNIDFNPYEDIPTDEKIKMQLYKDFKVMYVLNTVEENFDVIDYRCFRLYMLLRNMTYAKLREMTGIMNCKTRVVRINKWLRENISEEKIRRSFEDGFPDFG